MHILKEFITLKQNTGQPIYLQITNGFIRNIRMGRLRKGLKLPGSRQLADLLNVNRMTVVAAYNELEAQEWIETIPRKGTFVMRNFPDINPVAISEQAAAGHFPKKAGFPLHESNETMVPVKSGTYPLVIDDGFPDIRLGIVEQLMQSMRGILDKPVYKKHLGYGSPFGVEELRNTLSAYLSDTRGLPVAPQNLLITNGAQMGISLMAGLLVDKGDPVIVGEPGYFGANLAFQQRGASIDGVPVDEQGIVVDEIEKICKKKPVKLVYVVPHHHHPTTVTLTPERRIRLLELAARYHFAIIEDDYDYDFHYASSPMLPMASLDHSGNVIYVGTFTKSLAPSVRMGFIVAAENVIREAAKLRKGIDFQGDSLKEMAISVLLKDGTVERHIKKSVKLYRSRRDYFCRLLRLKLGDRVSFSVPDGGMSVWVRFNDVDLENLFRAAFQNGLLINNGKEYSLLGKNYHSIRMGFASLNFEEQEEAIDILEKSLNSI